MAQIVSNLGTRRAIRRGHRSYLLEGLAYLGEALVGASNRLAGWVERRRTRHHLYQMPDYMLQDIGVSRAEVEGEWSKPFWKA
jgi:uncharacterized protein YjiS (DUF1127 family)